MDSSGFKVLEKKSLSNSDFVTSTKLQISTEPFSSSMMPATCTHHHGINLDRPFVGDDDDGGANEAGGNIYRHGGIFGQNNLQPFNIFPSTVQYRPQGMMMGFPFTGAQMKELEQQALIYKYMISSVPVPIHLLPQLSRNFPGSSLSSIYSGGRYAKNGDPEPGRCKRTDGKKWRCSKEVAPQQKYCERHLHRGRPRSRKPVELKDQNQKKTRLIDQNQNQNQNQNKSLPAAKSDSVSANEPILLLNAKTDLTISTPPYYNREGRIVASEQPWESDCYIPQQFVEEQQQPLDHVFSYPNLPTGGFIDAWSIDNLNTRNTKHSIPSLNDGDLDLCPSLNLSMAMAAGDVVDREMRNINVDDRKTKDAMWLSPISWGPLGEALAVGGSTPASPYSTPATTVSSPSGVLHWTLFSDNSVCNSPTFVAPPSEQGHKYN